MVMPPIQNSLYYSRPTWSRRVPAVTLRYHLSPLIMRALLARCLVCACAACAGKATPPGVSDPGASPQISGTERLGWSQQANGSDNLAGYHFFLYIDGGIPNRTAQRLLHDRPRRAFDCNGRLPGLPAGTHSLDPVRGGERRHRERAVGASAGSRGAGGHVSGHLAEQAHERIDRRRPRRSRPLHRPDFISTFMNSPPD